MAQSRQKDINNITRYNQLINLLNEQIEEEENKIKCLEESNRALKDKSSDYTTGMNNQSKIDDNNLLIEESLTKIRNKRELIKKYNNNIDELIGENNLPQTYYKRQRQRTNVLNIISIIILVVIIIIVITMIILMFLNKTNFLIVLISTITICILLLFLFVQFSFFTRYSIIKIILLLIIIVLYITLIVSFVIYGYYNNSQYYYNIIAPGVCIILIIIILGISLLY